MMRAAAFVVLAGPACAQGFALPQGCTAYATTQMRSCLVTHYFNCADDPEGVQRRVIIDEGGVRGMSRINAETEWLGYQNFVSGTSYVLGDATDPARFSTLIETGRDDYDFTIVYDSGQVVRFVGTDTLTGEEVVIDGQRLLRTQFSARALRPDGSEHYRVQGNEFIHPDWGRFIGGTDTYTYPDGSTESHDESPVTFALPGEPGFLAARPDYDCDDLMS